MEYYIAQSMPVVRYSAPIMPTPRHYSTNISWRRHSYSRDVCNDRRSFANIAGCDVGVTSTTIDAENTGSYLITAALGAMLR